MNLQLTRQNHGFEENNSSVTNAQRPLARGRDCDIFALRLRERPPEPPERLLEFFDPSPQRPLSHTTLKVIDVLLTRSESKSLRDSGRQLARQPYNAPAPAQQGQHELSNHFGCGSTPSM